MAITSLSQSALSTQYVQVQVTATVNGTSYNPTGDTVQMAFVTVTSPPASPSAWNAAAWETDPGPVYWASCLVGPSNGGVVLAAGSYFVWVKVTDSPAVPVLSGPILTIT